MFRGRRRWVVIGVVALIVVAVGLGAAIAGGLLLRDAATPVSIQDVLQRFHEGETPTGDLDGVYLYATRGRESVDALGGARHEYPARTAITVATVPCGLRLRWEALEERSATWTLCATALGIELQGWEVTHRFFGRSDSTSYVCTAGVLVPALTTASSTSPLRCRSGSARQAGHARLVGKGGVAVKGARRGAVHVRTEGHVTGGDEGIETVDWWFDERTGLPLRIVLRGRTSRPFIVGDVHYSEDADLRLLSLTPLR